MNNVSLIGRLCDYPTLRYSASQMAVATFTLAIDRPPSKDGEKKADFPRIMVFGRTAENCEKYLKKGQRVAVSGRIQTGSYKNQSGVIVYTTDVIADRVEFLEFAKEERTAKHEEPTPEGFAALDEEIPF